VSLSFTTTDSGDAPMEPKNPSDDQVTNEMIDIERAARQKRLDDDQVGELAFFRLLRDAFTEFLDWF
jgi:hypothetical protein